MKIDSIDIYPISIDRNEIFRIATGSSKTAENVVVKITIDGVEGWGNGTPNSVTKETTESILKAMKIMKKDLEGEEVDVDEIWTHLDSKFPHDRAAIAGVDVALHDALAKSEGKNLTDFLGGERAGVLTDRTIGIMTYGDTVDHAVEYKRQGFKALKIKVGLDIFDDIRRIQAVRDEIGDDMKIWIDANQGYTVQEAITFCSKIEQFDIEFVEQPVREDDLDGLKKVTEDSPIPIMADETVKDHDMAEKICSEGIADMVNIKLMKCGGITGGKKIVEVMEKYEVDGMVGCMGEVEPSIVASTHLYNSTDRLKYADLDSHFMLSDSISRGLSFEEGKLWTVDKPGLGIEVFESKVKEYLMDLEANI